MKEIHFFKTNQPLAEGQIPLEKIKDELSTGKNHKITLPYSTETLQLFRVQARLDIQKILRM